MPDVSACRLWPVRASPRSTAPPQAIVDARETEDRANAKRRREVRILANRATYIPEFGVRGIGALRLCRRARGVWRARASQAPVRRRRVRDAFDVPPRCRGLWPPRVRTRSGGREPPSAR